jgi:hypothetical protein
MSRAMVAQEEPEPEYRCTLSKRSGYSWTLLAEPGCTVRCEWCRDRGPPLDR